MTDQYAVLGNPIAHSKSPQIHSMFAAQTGQDIRYEAILVPLDGFAATVERLRQEGYKGCNVTLPFKHSAYQLSDQKHYLSYDVVHAHAANTLEFKSDGVHLHNTDGIGLIRDLQDNRSVPLRGKRVLLMGAGGAAMGVISPLRDAGANITVANRTVDRAILLAERFVVSSCSYQDLADRQFDVVINATSAGLSDDMPPLPSGLFAPGALAYEMMYGRVTPFMRFAREHGASTVSDGLGMLVEQAAASFFIWRGVRPDTAPVIAALRDRR